MTFIPWGIDFRPPKDKNPPFPTCPYCGSEWHGLPEQWCKGSIVESDQ